jgi:DNA-binding MarR family transcriptional regulator
LKGLKEQEFRLTPTRLKVLEAVSKLKIPFVGRVAEKAGIEQSQASVYLRHLWFHGFVKKERRGPKTVYRLTEKGKLYLKELKGLAEEELEVLFNPTHLAVLRAVEEGKSLSSLAEELELTLPALYYSRGCLRKLGLVRCRKGFGREKVYSLTERGERLLKKAEKLNV